MRKMPPNWELIENLCDKWSKNFGTLISQLKRIHSLMNAPNERKLTRSRAILAAHGPDNLFFLDENNFTVGAANNQQMVGSCKNSSLCSENIKNARRTQNPAESVMMMWGRNLKKDKNHFWFLSENDSNQCSQIRRHYSGTFCEEFQAKLISKWRDSIEFISHIRRAPEVAQ